MTKHYHYLFSISVISVVVFCFFFCMSLKANAATNQSAEAFFIHTHNDSCYTDVERSCVGKHTCSHATEYKEFHCHTCGHFTMHFLEADTYICLVKDSRWQKNGYAKCTICGTIHSTWDGDYSGNHTYLERVLACRITEGDPTIGICISADSEWTNSTVTLNTNINKLINDLTNDNITLDWGSTQKVVSENGTYSVEARSNSGQTVSTSITISNIDKIAPVINSITPDTDTMTKDHITVTISASDETSGLADTPYSFDGGASFQTGTQFVVMEGKDYTCVVRDRAGNQSSCTVRRRDFPYPPEPVKQEESTPPPATNQSTNQSGSTSQGESNTQSGTATQSNPNNQSSQNMQSNQNTQSSNNTQSTHFSGDNKKTDSSGKSADKATPEENQFKSDNQKDSTKKSDNIKSSSKKDNKQASLDELESDINDIMKDSDKDASLTGAYSETSESGKELKSGEIINIYRLNPQNRKGDLNMQEDNNNNSNKHNDDNSNNQNENKDSNNNSDNQKTALLSGTGAFNGMNRSSISRFLNRYGTTSLGILLILVCLLVMGRLIWTQTVFLYCYNGGEEYRKLGLLHLKKTKKEFSVFLPDYLLNEAETPRYRLLVHKDLVKHHGKKEIVLQSEDHKLRQPLEECVDFVL